jgi:hypothetical protein
VRSFKSFWHLTSGLRLPLEFVFEIDHLANVVLHVSSALQNHFKAIPGIGTDAGIFCRPTVGRLRFDCFQRYVYGVIEAFESFVFRGGIGIIELAGTITDVTGLRDLRADVVVQIAGEMKDEVAEAVAIGKWFLPELGWSDRRSEFANARGVPGVAVSKRGGKC